MSKEYETIMKAGGAVVGGIDKVLQFKHEAKVIQQRVAEYVGTYNLGAEYNLNFLSNSRYLTTSNRPLSLLKLFFFSFKFRFKMNRLRKQLANCNLNNYKLSDNPNSLDYYLFEIEVWNPELGEFEGRIMGEQDALYFLLLNHLILNFRNNIETLNQYSKGIQFDNPESFLALNFEVLKLIEFGFKFTLASLLIIYPYLPLEYLIHKMFM